MDGVHTTDPRVERGASKLERFSYEEMLELASMGAKVLQTRSVELAMRYKVRLQVLSSFEDAPGTLVCDEEEILEQDVVSGIAFSQIGRAARRERVLWGVWDCGGAGAVGIR